jgi:hypothetical protein
MNDTDERIYCTYFDNGYLSRALTLFESLRMQGDDSKIIVLALDTQVQEYFDRNPLPNIEVISISVLEVFEPRLPSLKMTRSKMEYYLTCTPLLVKYALEKTSSTQALSIYLDADLYFFANPDNVLADLTGADVGIIEHRYPAHRAEKLAKYGRFNVGWVGFRNTKEGRQVLDWYAEKTIDWCSDIPDSGRYADQGYLDWFPEFENVRVLTNSGFNVAPWNTSRHKLTLNNSNVESDGSPLIFFHFHGVRKVGKRFTTSQLIYGSPLNKVLRESIYQLYINRLDFFDHVVSDALGAESTIKKRGNGIIGLLSRVRKKVFDAITIATGNSLVPRNK